MSANYALYAQKKSELAEKPLAERERALWSASEKYMRGEITLDELKEVEHPYYSLELEEAISRLGGSLDLGKRRSLLMFIIRSFFNPPQGVLI